MTSTNDTSTGTFDPLEERATDAANAAIKRRLENIVSSYKNSVDVLAEPVQNGMDAIARAAEEGLYQSEDEATDNSQETDDNDPNRPQLTVTIDTDENRISVSDEGRGFPLDELKEYIAPEGTNKGDWFQDGTVRGHKGVGLSFLAYGFNSFRVRAKTPNGDPYELSLEGGRDWVEGDQSTDSSRPKAEWEFVSDDEFNGPHGTTITIETDDASQPSSLSHAFNTAEMTKTILETQTAIGVVPPNFEDHHPVDARLKYVDHEVIKLSLDDSYRFPHMKLNGNLNDGESELETINIDKYEYNFSDDNAHKGVLPGDQDRYHGVYRTYGTEDIMSRIDDAHTGEVLQEPDELKKYIKEHKLEAYVLYTYSNKYAERDKGKGIKERWDIRGNRKYHSPGVRIATDGMISTWHRPADLTYSAARSRRLWFVYHFQNVKPDTGRKDFPPEVHDVLDGTEQFLHKGVVTDGDPFLRPTPRSGPEDVDTAAPPLRHSMEMEGMPFNEVGSFGQLPHSNEPNEEQDVVAIFNQMAGAGVFDCYEIGYISSTRPYDGFAEYQSSSVPSKLRDRFPGSTDLTPQDSSIVFEFKKYGADIIEHVVNETRDWEDMDLLICWSLGGDDDTEMESTVAQREYGGNMITFKKPTSGEERKYAGVTHLANLSSKGDIELRTISLKHILKELSNSS